MADPRPQSAHLADSPDPDDALDPTLTDPADAAQSRLGAQLGMIIRAILASPVGRKVISLCVGILLVIVATTYGQIRLNEWSKPFYDALSRR
ncbi:MAG: ABC transporter ATP-binding protein/permease, partial [Steroidobacteraceae bacterium]